jgi:L-malate glycosyltransferase
MKIGICCYPTHGGSGVVATELGLELAKRGHTIHFISYQRPFRLNHLIPGVYFHQVEVSEYPLFDYPPYSLALASKIVEVSRRNGMDIVHAHYAIPHTVSAWMASEMIKDKELPVVSTLHGTDITLIAQEPGYRPVTQFALENTKAITAVSDFLVTETKNVLSLDLNITRIHNFVDVEEFKPRCNHKLRSRFCDTDEKLILHISNFRPVKRVSDVVKIFNAIQQKTNSRLLLAGSGPEKPLVKELVTQLGLQDKVCFLGTGESIVDLMSISDLFVLPSETESFGLAALEAMSCGIPVIASKVGGLPELIEHGSNGFLFPLGDIETAADYAIELLNNTETYDRIALCSRERAQDQFAVDKIIPEYLAVYENALL